MNYFYNGVKPSRKFLLGFWFWEEQNSVVFKINGLLSLNMLVLGLICELEC